MIIEFMTSCLAKKVQGPPRCAFFLIPIPEVLCFGKFDGTKISQTHSEMCKDLKLFYFLCCSFSLLLHSFHYYSFTALLPSLFFFLLLPHSFFYYSFTALLPSCFPPSSLPLPLPSFTKTGFLGEGVPIAPRTTLLHKTHGTALVPIYHDLYPRYRLVDPDLPTVLLIRDPAR